MSSPLSIQQLRLLPKVDLHRHLDCSMRWSTMLEIATTLKLNFPQKPADQARHFLVTDPMVNLEAVLSKFLTAQKLLASEEILERLAFEACEDAFNDGIRILELRYAPTFIADGHANLTFEKIHQALLRGIKKAKQKFPIAVGLICIVQRILPVNKAEQVVNFAIENKDSFIAVDLADNEDGFEPATFAKLFQHAKKEGLHVTIHSGESPNAKAGQWIKDSIELLGAERIGHGIQCIHFPEIQKILKDKDITLEVCPYSNYLTQAFPTYATHPLKKLFDLNIPITLNSDDPGIFASTLTDDYWIAQHYHQFDLNHFNKCNQQAYQASFIPKKEKDLVW